MTLFLPAWLLFAICTLVGVPFGALGNSSCCWVPCGGPQFSPTLPWVKAATSRAGCFIFCASLFSWTWSVIKNLKGSFNQLRHRVPQGPLLPFVTSSVCQRHLDHGTSYRSFLVSQDILILHSSEIRREFKFLTSAQVELWVEKIFVLFGSSQ